MKASGKKHKGARLERKIAKVLRSSGLDKKAKRSFQSGATWFWKSDIYTSLNFSIEAKNQERLRIWDWWQQTRSQRKAYSPPVLMFTSNHRPILVAMDLDDWVNLVKEREDWKEKASKLEGGDSSA